MTTLVLKEDPVAIDVKVSPEQLLVYLNDGRSISIPLEWYPRLLHASPAERDDWQLLGDGYAIEWPGIDEHIGIEGLIAGRRSGESTESLNRWLTSRSTG